MLISVSRARNEQSPLAQRSIKLLLLLFENLFLEGAAACRHGSLGHPSSWKVQSDHEPVAEESKAVFLETLRFGLSALSGWQAARARGSVPDGVP